MLGNRPANISASPLFPWTFLNWLELLGFLLALCTLLPLSPPITKLNKMREKVREASFMMQLLYGTYLKGFIMNA